MEKELHIISLTVPYPVDYGGVFDLFYKLPALQQQGVRIHLHCFDYGRGRQPELDQYCASVNYYDRTKEGFTSALPYIVASRKNEALFQNLLKDDHPILVEGIHCTALLKDDRFAGRKCFVRLHNAEFAYYADLYKAARSPFKKLFYKRESVLLKRYEKSIANKASFLAVTEKDAAVYRDEFGCRDITYLPLFLPWKTNTLPGMGSYCLYQGDLSVEANTKTAMWLVKEVFAGMDISFKIAGKKPPRSLQKAVSSHPNITLTADPTGDEMQELVANAHINILPSFSNTGIKLKLLNALFNGRHCVVNKATVEGTGFDELCHIADTADHFKNLVSQLYHQPFREEETAARRRMLDTHFDNAANALKLIKMTRD